MRYILPAGSPPSRPVAFKRTIKERPRQRQLSPNKSSPRGRKIDPQKCEYCVQAKKKVRTPCTSVYSFLPRVIWYRRCSAKIVSVITHFMARPRAVNVCLRERLVGNEMQRNYNWGNLSPINDRELKAPKFRLKMKQICNQTTKPISKVDLHVLC